MLLFTIYENPAFVGLVLAMPSSILGYLVYKQSQKADETAKQGGIATVESGTIGQVIDGLNKLVDNLQTDNEVLRTNIDTLNTKLTRVIEYCEELKLEIAKLSTKLLKEDA